jgi:hypothetical protein
MSGSALHRLLGGKPVPRTASSDEKTRELPAAAIPEQIHSDEDTVPVQSSLENILRHEMLRHQSERDDEEDLRPGEAVSEDAPEGQDP